MDKMVFECFFSLEIIVNTSFANDDSVVDCVEKNVCS